MRKYSTNPKILITNSYMRDKKDYYDTFAVNVPYRPRLSYQTRSGSVGLRFIKENIPEIVIMENPSWDEYCQVLGQGWDVVGFSFLHYELGKIIRMVEEARRQGVREIWAGSYGALSPQARFADRVWTGYCEKELASEVFNRKLDTIVHPVLISNIYIDIPPTFRVRKIGGLYTQRGCPYRCTFCQAPAYAPYPSKIPLASIKRVLANYASLGIRDIAIHDETFGIFPEHSERVIEMLASEGFRWSVGSRIDKIVANLDHWSDAGLSFVGFGVESLRTDSLKKINKTIDPSLLPELSRKTRRKGVVTTAYYMIGYEDDTSESIAEDMVELRNLGFDSYQLTVNTPFPKTLQWNYINESFGIIDDNPTHYDTRHLVWNHPSISPAQMRYLLISGCALLNNPFSGYLKGVSKMYLRQFRNRRILARTIEKFLLGEDLA
jgi:radical SAM superfamily enzyme YgiQ (UPF0313 family)